MALVGLGGMLFGVGAGAVEVEVGMDRGLIVEDGRDGRFGRWRLVLEDW